MFLGVELKFARPQLLLKPPGVVLQTSLAIAEATCVPTPTSSAQKWNTLATSGVIWSWGEHVERFSGLVVSQVSHFWLGESHTTWVLTFFFFFSFLARHFVPGFKTK